MFLVNIFAQLIAVLRAAATPRQIAGGFVIGMCIGLIPSFFVSMLLYLALIIFNVNIASAILAILLGNLFVRIFDPVLHYIGYVVLVRMPFLVDFWTWLYDLPLIPFTNFNNTVAMGSIIVSALLAFPVYTGIKKCVVTYRLRYERKVLHSRYMQLFRTTALYQLYIYLRNLRSKMW